ncbi:MAG: M23 family metallopeptidase [Firmicutes bacterium]|nr:M23 family metallopeptidase [Bacillota bacterium]
MRTYGNSKKTNDNNSRKKLWYGVFFTALVLVAAVIITLSVVLTRPDTPILGPDPGPGNGGDYVGGPPPAPTWTMPVKGEFSVAKPVSLNRLVWHESTRNFRTQNGIDFATQAGANVYAIGAGTVTRVDRTSRYNTIVEIQHADGLVSRYKGLNVDDEYIKVAVGDTVAVGDQIGTVAQHTPNKSHSGPVVHVGMWNQNTNRFVDPANFITDLADK